MRGRSAGGTSGAVGVSCAHCPYEHHFIRWLVSHSTKLFPGLYIRLVECAPIFGALVHNAPLSAL